MVGRRSFRRDDLIANFIDQAATLKKKYWIQLAKILQVWANESSKKQGQTDHLSVQSIQDARVTQEVYKNIIAPSELHVLEAANEAGGVNILHICGYEGARNDIHLFTDYPAQVINWAVGPEGISLQKDAKSSVDARFLVALKMEKWTSLHRRIRLRSKQKPKRIIAETGTTGLVIGADCTIPVTLMKNESNGFVKLQQNKENRKRENRVWVKKHGLSVGWPFLPLQVQPFLVEAWTTQTKVKDQQDLIK